MRFSPPASSEARTRQCRREGVRLISSASKYAPTKPVTPVSRTFAGFSTTVRSTARSSRRSSICASASRLIASAAARSRRSFSSKSRLLSGESRPIP